MGNPRVVPQYFFCSPEVKDGATAIPSFAVCIKLIIGARRTCSFRLNTVLYGSRSASSNVCSVKLLHLESIVVLLSRRRGQKAWIAWIIRPWTVHLR